MAVLAYLALSERPVARARLAELIFGGADDPLGALRWALAQLRRALGTPDALAGDPLVLGLPEGTLLDVGAITGEDADASLARGELLEGIEPGAGPVFDAWLLVERRRLAGASEALLHEAAHAALAAGRPLDGAALASGGLAADPFDEDAHELLVRCLAAAGDTKSALDQRRGLRGALPEGARPPARRARAVRRRAARSRHAARRLDRERAAVLAVRGMALSDRAHYEPAIRMLDASIATARGCGDERRAAWSLALLGRARIVRGELEEAEELLDGSLALVRQTGWISFQPFPEALRAEVALRRGDPQHAAELLDHLRARLPARRTVLGGGRRARLGPAPRGGR